MPYTLYLGSKSQSRQQLLREAQIPFVLLDQTADESACDATLPLDQLVLSISLYKMDHVIVPKGIEGDIAFVLTGDTLSQDKDGRIEGKPVDRADAVRKIKKARNGTRLCSAFCLDKKQFKNGAWHTITRIHQVVHAEYKFIIPDEWIEEYLDKSLGLSCSNAIAVELYGAQFLKETKGSYSAIVGLPMFELREALTQLGFFEK
jgi:septum formation protein